MVNAIIFLVAIVLTVVIGMKSKINMGIIGLFFAILIGMLRLDMKVSAIFKTMNTSLFLNMFTVMLFYGVAKKSGAFDVLAGKLIYKFKGAAKLMPILIFVAAAILQGAGNDNANVILAPFAYGIAMKLGFSPLVAVFGVWAGIMATMHMPWNGIANIDGSVIAAAYNDETATQTLLMSVLLSAIFFVIYYVVLCIVTKSFNIKSTDTGITENPKFNDSQKKVIIIVAAVLLLTIVPMIIHLLAPSAVTKWMTKYLSFYTLAIAGTIAILLVRKEDAPKAIKEVPWNPLILITGMSILFGLCQSLGVVDLLSEAVSKVPSILIAPGMVLICGFLSFFVSATVLGPMFLPLGEMLATAAGVNPIFMLATILNGGGITSCSPVSSVGAVTIASATDAETKTNLSAGMAKFAVINMFVYAIYTFLMQFIIG